MVSGWIQPREYLRAQLNWDEYYKEKEETKELRNATEQELYDAGWKTNLIEIDGKNCIKQKSEIIWCD